MHYNADLIVLDEPTVALAVEGGAQGPRLRPPHQGRRGRACVYIEHNLAHVHEVADRLIVLDRGRVVARGQPAGHVGDRAHRVPDRPAAQGVSDGADAGRRRMVAADRGAADHPRLRAAARRSSCGTAPQVFLQPFIYTTFLSTLPPLILLAVGLTFVIGAGEIDLSFPAIIAFSGFVFAVLFKEYELGWLAVVAGARLRPPRRLRQRHPHRQDRHPLLHRDARHAVLLGRHGDGALGRQVLRAARRRGELGLAGGSSAARSPARRPIWVGAAADAGALDGADRRLPLVHPEPPPLRRARALHRRFQRRVARRRHRRRAREDQALHADGRRSPRSPRSC